MEKNIETLVLKAKQNDEQSQAELVRITYQKAYFVAYNIVRNEEIAKDILQEAYITAFQKIYQLKDDEKFIAWFSRIVNNKTIDYLRSKEGKNQEVAFSTLDHEEDDLLFEENIRDEKIEWNPEGNMDYQVLKEGLQEVLNTLPDKQRMALLMYYFEEKSVSEIAETMGVGQSAIKSALAYGRKKIKDCIEAMRAKGTSFYGFAPLSIFMNVMDFESSKVSLEGVSSIVKAVTETGGVIGGTIATAEASKHGVSGIAKWWASKSAGVKIGACVATTAVAGSGAYALVAEQSTTWVYTTPATLSIIPTDEVNYYYPNCYFSFYYSPLTKELTRCEFEYEIDLAKAVEYASQQNTEYVDGVYELYSEEAMYEWKKKEESISSVKVEVASPKDGVNRETTVLDLKDFEKKDKAEQEYIFSNYGMWISNLYDEEKNKFYYSDEVETWIESINDSQGNIVEKVDFIKK